HCLRAVEFTCDLATDHGPLGRVYRTLAEKHVLHLALLLHDLGKGHLEDHCELGRGIAESAATRLALKEHEAEQLRFLAVHHNLMNHLAFRRDTSDERLVVRFAVKVGTPELLKMLYIHTAADLAAVGPGVLDGWKIEVLTELYHRAMQHLAGDSAVTTVTQQFTTRRQAAQAALGGASDPWFARQLDTLPEAYLLQTQPDQIAADLQALRATPAGLATAVGRYMPETESVVYTVYTSEDVVPGIFHRLCGALASHGLEIRGAQINTLADRLVLDRFWVVDPDYAGEPPASRIAAVNQTLAAALTAPSAHASPTFRRMWNGAGGTPPTARRAQSRVQMDNATSDRYTILDVFTYDRTGLLYAITRTLFELGLSVWRAKIGTHIDQVVDVFYVTDTEDRKITDPVRLQEIHDRLVEALVDS
ncbi:MAG: [protein-PII] uridylyltransferase, partial [Patescibacteria group bacterium]|nr:[protein-PII] uridylyltransferase [Patescibacteria group bacterium]